MVIVGRQHGRTVYAKSLVVTDSLRDGSTKYLVRVKHVGRLSPGKVTWLAYLLTRGDVDGPGGDTARTSTRLVEHHGRHERT